MYFRLILTMMLAEKMVPNKSNAPRAMVTTAKFILAPAEILAIRGFSVISSWAMLATTAACKLFALKKMPFPMRQRFGNMGILGQWSNVDSVRLLSLSPTPNFTLTLLFLL